MKSKNFTVFGILKLTIGIPIKAKNLEEAVKETKELKVQDFVKILGDYMDGEVKINGILYDDDEGEKL